MKLRTAFLILCFAIGVNALAQSKRVKWGQLSWEEINLKAVPFDSGAEAAVLRHSGLLSFRENVNIEFHKRIKILSDKALDRGTVSIPYYSNGGKNFIYNIKAQTLLAGEDGKIECIPLKKKEIFQVSTGKNWSEVRFSFPKVRKGAIIEYKYILSTENYRFLNDWNFQEDIPTLYSRFEALWGNSLGLVYTIVKYGERLKEKYDDSGNRLWELENLPALKDEPNIFAPNDFQEKLEFQLSHYKTSGNYHKATLSSWGELVKEMYNDSKPGPFLKAGAKVRKLAETLRLDSKSDMDKMKLIYSYVQKNYQWNQKYYGIKHSSVSGFLKDKKGTSWEINGLLTGLLQAAGLDCLPLLISTRDHGMPRKIYPIASQFNHVLAYVRINGKEYFLSAVDPLRPYNMLGYLELQSEGFLLDKKNPRWIKIKPQSKKGMRIYSTRIKLDEQIGFEISQKIRLSGYEALWARKILCEKTPEALWGYLVPELETENGEVERGEIAVENQDKLEKAVQLSCTYRTKPEQETNRHYIPPFLWNLYKKNPYTWEKKNLPFELPYDTDYRYISSIEVPEGYEITGVPKNIALEVPGKYAYYAFISHNNGFAHNLSLRVAQKSHLISSKYYPIIRNFYTKIMEHQKGMLVISKKEEQ